MTFPKCKVRMNAINYIRLLTIPYIRKNISKDGTYKGCYFKSFRL